MILLLPMCNSIYYWVFQYWPVKNASFDNIWFEHLIHERTVV